MSKLTEYTIEENRDYHFWAVFEWTTYGRSSVLAGQDCKRFIEEFPTVAEAVKAYPAATVGYRDPCNTFEHLPHSEEY